MYLFPSSKPQASNIRMPMCILHCYCHRFSVLFLSLFTLLHYFFSLTPICDSNILFWINSRKYSTEQNFMNATYTQVTLNSSVFWDTMPFNPLIIHTHLGETSHLHLQGRKVSQARNQHESGSKENSALQPWRWMWYVPRKHQFTFNGLYRITFLISS
jgi:hypothetical protein